MEHLRAQFPALHDGETYLDTAATAHKPLAVIEAMDNFLRSGYGTVHRGMYQRSVASTQAFEKSRSTIANFLGAPSAQNIVFTMGTTDAINLVAWSWGRKHLRTGDIVLISEMEHHANIVPWQLLSEITGCVLQACPVLDDGSLDMAAFDTMLTEQVKLVSIVHISNALGTINPVHDIVTKAHANGSKVLIDGAQSSPHMPVNVTELDCDFFVCSAHKLYGPTGIGALYAKSDVLESMPPWRGGGEMIERVTIAKSTFAPPPSRFEAGTPPIVEAIGFAAACTWMEANDRNALTNYEHDLFTYAENRMADIPNIRRIGTAEQRTGVLSFVLGDAHASDISSILDMEGVAIRAGHHCAQPIMDRFAVPATARISLGVYNNRADIDTAVAALHKVSDIFG